MKGKLVFNTQLTKMLLKKGFKIIDIRPNNKNRERTVFVFEDTEELKKEINEYVENSKK